MGTPAPIHPERLIQVADAICQAMLVAHEKTCSLLLWEHHLFASDFTKEEIAEGKAFMVRLGYLQPPEK